MPLASWEDKSLSGSILNFIFLIDSLSQQEAKAFSFLLWNFRGFCHCHSAATEAHGLAVDVFCSALYFYKSVMIEEQKSFLWVWVARLECSHGWDLAYASRSHSAAHFLLLQSPWTVLLLSVSEQKETNSLRATLALSPSCSVWAVWTHW